MKLYLLLIMVLMISSLFADKGTEAIDEACNCDHCSLTTKDNKKNIDSSNVRISKICARGRDLPDREFPSVCYMLCYNRCTRWRISDNQIATAYRTNYYKLREGTCGRT